MNREAPRVGIVLGSESDRAVAERIEEVLASLGIPFETIVASAHRDPEKVRMYAAGAEMKGLEVLIGVAGMAAALPGVMASHSIVPVIGVPVGGGPLGGMDAILSIVQLPAGVPAAAVALGASGGVNAALLAGRILALHDEGLREKVRAYRHAGGKNRRAKRSD